jgi:hypothetical protein
MSGACSTYEGEGIHLYTGFWCGSLRERDHLEVTCMDGRTILRWFFKKWDVEVWIGLSCLRIETGTGTRECGIEPSGSIKCREFPVAEN